MNKKVSLLLALVLILPAIWIINVSLNSKDKETKSNTPGIATLTFRTVAAGGSYAPRHVLAVWVEDNIGTFVKTNLLRGNSKKQYLYTWKSASNYNVVDAITGSTLSSHTTHSVSWDCKDISGNFVPDGNYTIYMEFTDKHAQGPLCSLTFNKGLSPVTINPADETYFKDIGFTYWSNIGIEETEKKISINAYPNPFTDKLKISYNNSHNGFIQVDVFNIKGQKVHTKKIDAIEKGYVWDASSVGKGVYIIKLRTAVQENCIKVLKI